MRMQLGLALCACSAMLVGCGGGASVAPAIPAAPVMQSGAVQPAGSSTAPGASSPAAGSSPTGSNVEPLLSAELTKLLSASATLPALHPPNLPAQRAQVYLSGLISSGVPDSLPAVELKWSEGMPGDFNVDGTVTVADLDTLVQHFGESNYTPPPPGGLDTYLFARIDDDDNGTLGFGDLTAIARYWNSTLDGYQVYRRPVGASTWTLLPSHDYPPGSTVTCLRELALQPDSIPQFNYIDQPPAAGVYEYQVVPISIHSGGEGIASLPVAVEVQLGSPYIPKVYIYDDGPAVLGQARTFTVLFNLSQSELPATLDFDRGADGSYETHSSASGATNSVNETVTFNQSGEQLVRVRLTTTDGEVGYGLARFSVRLANHPPVIAPDIVLAAPTAPTTVYVDGGLSYDPDGDTFSWNVELLPPGQTTYVPVHYMSYYATAAGTYQVRATATDAMGAAASWSGSFTLLPGGINPQWDSTTVITDPAYGDTFQISPAVTGDVPGLLVTTGASDTRYLRANDATGLSWPAQSSAVRIDGGLTMWRVPALQNVNGRPAALLFSGVSSAYKLEYTVGLDDSGQSWTAPVLAANLVNTHNDIPQTVALLDGRPALIWADELGQVHQVQAGDSFGTVWPASDNIIPGVSATQAALLTGVTDPAIVYEPARTPVGTYIGSNYPGIMLMRRNAQGEWATAQTLPGPGQLFMHAESPPLFAAAPLLLCQGINGDGTVSLTAQPALDPDGHTWGPPQRLPTVPGYSSYATQFTPGVVNGRLTLAYVDPGSSNLVWTQATDNTDSHWTSPEVLDSINSVSQILAMQELAGQPGVLYFVTTGSTPSSPPTGVEVHLVRRRSS